MCAGSRGIETGTAADIASIASLGCRIDELSLRTVIKTVSCSIGKIESFLALCAIEIGSFSASHALEGAAVAVHCKVGHVHQLEVIEIWAVASVVGHVGDVAIETGVDACVIKEIGFVSSQSVAASTIS